MEESLKIFFSDLNFQWQEILEIYNKIEDKFKSLESNPDNETEWYIKLDPQRGELDLSGLRKREFTEY